MKKYLEILFCAGLLIFVTGCAIEEYYETQDNISNPKVTCTTETQYSGDYGIGYYIEGICTNNGNYNYNYLQIEFICYDSDGNNLGTALDNANNILAGQTWKYKAMALTSNDEKIDHCDYHEVTGW